MIRRAMGNAHLSERYRVYLTGGIRSERAPDDIASELASALGLSRTALRSALDAGSELTLKRGLDRTEAERWVMAVLDAGARCRMVEDDEAGVEPELPRAVGEQGEETAARRGDAPVADTRHADESAELAAFVDVNTEYYLERFAELRQGNAIVLRPSWNLAAFLAPGPWALYRKMYLWAVLLTVAGVPVVANVLMGLFGNYLYLRAIRGQVSDLRRDYPSGDITARLAARGGVHGWIAPVAMAVGGVLGGLVIVGTIAAIAIPSCMKQRHTASTEYADYPDEQTGQSLSDPSGGGEASGRAFRAGAARAQTMSRMMRLRAAVAVAEAERGAIPASLSELDGVEGSDLTDSWGERIALERAGDGAAIRSAGPDRTAGTPDDLVVQVFGAARQ